MVEYNLDEEGKRLVTKSGLNYSNKIAYVNPKDTGAIGLHCKICDELFYPPSITSSEFICPECKEAVRWLKKHIGILDVIINKEWNK